MTQLAVAVSGGVDSLCALLRLREQGHDVLALHGLFLPDAASSGLRPVPEGPRLLTAAEALAAPLPPASRQAVEGLQTACGQLGIPLHVADMRAVFDREVVTPFVRAYARGRTPNPCALCNRAIKFGALLDAALSLGADRIATITPACWTAPPGPCWPQRTTWPRIRAISFPSCRWSACAGPCSPLPGRTRPPASPR